MQLSDVFGGRHFSITSQAPEVQTASTRARAICVPGSLLPCCLAASGPEDATMANVVKRQSQNALHTNNRQMQCISISAPAPARCGKPEIWAEMSHLQLTDNTISDREGVHALINRPVVTSCWRKWVCRPASCSGHPAAAQHNSMGGVGTLQVDASAQAPCTGGRHYNHAPVILAEKMFETMAAHSACQAFRQLSCNAWLWATTLKTVCRHRPSSLSTDAWKRGLTLCTCAVSNASFAQMLHILINVVVT